MTRAKDISKILTDADISGNIDVDGVTNLDVVDIDGAVDMASTLTVTGVAILNGGIDIAGDFTLDVGGGDIAIKDDGTTMMNIGIENSDVIFNAQVSDKDIIFKGTDGGSSITALTLDMSDAGTAVFNHDIKLADNGQLQLGTGSDFKIYHDGTNNYILGNGQHPLLFLTTDQERARIQAPSTSHSGYFKISDSGTYRDVNGGFHEIASSSSGQPSVNVGMTHASYTGSGVQIISTRAASGADFQLIEGFTGNAADRQFKVNSDGNFHADGSFSSSGADYAEMFEWKDGNSSSEDRVGKTVVLDGNQIRLSTSDDEQATIIGVVSARPVVLGDAQDEKWKDKYETDSYGRYVFEDYTQTEWTVETDDGAKELKSYQTDMIPSDVTVPDDAIVTSKDENGDNLKRRKLNTAYDKSKTYIPREDRKEYNAIGLVGKLRVNVGQTVGDRWIKMREISDTIHEYLVR